MTYRTRKQILLACGYVASLFVDFPVALAFMVLAAYIYALLMLTFGQRLLE